MQAADATYVRRGTAHDDLSSEEWRAGRQLLTRRGELVRSRAEVRIANHLHARAIDYEYEPRICGFRPDFFLPASGIVIEFWGMDEPAYQDRRRRKTQAYRSAGYGLVSLEYGKDVAVERDLDRQLYYEMKGR